MKLATIDNDREISALARRVYALPQNVSDSTLKRAEQTLAKANPHLRNIEKLPHDTPVVVPDTDDLAPDDEGASFSLVKDELMKRIADGLAEAQDLIERKGKQREAEAKQLTEDAKRNEVKVLGRTDPALMSRLKAISSKRTAEMKEAKKVQTDMKKAVREFEKDLTVLIKRGKV